MNVWPGPLQSQMGFRSDYRLRAIRATAPSATKTLRIALRYLVTGSFVFCRNETWCEVEHLISRYLFFLDVSFSFWFVLFLRTRLGSDIFLFIYVPMLSTILTLPIGDLGYALLRGPRSNYFFINMSAENKQRHVTRWLDHALPRGPSANCFFLNARWT